MHSFIWWGRGRGVSLQKGVGVCICMYLCVWVCMCGCVGAHVCMLPLPIASACCTAGDVYSLDSKHVHTLLFLCYLYLPEPDPLHETLSLPSPSPPSPSPPLPSPPFPPHRCV